jgi:hypothetical protein
MQSVQMDLSHRAHRRYVSRCGWRKQTGGPDTPSVSGAAVGDSSDGIFTIQSPEMRIAAGRGQRTAVTKAGADSEADSKERRLGDGAGYVR